MPDIGHFDVGYGNMINDDEWVSPYTPPPRAWLHIFRPSVEWFGSFFAGLIH
jgi:hypothetical protein